MKPLTCWTNYFDTTTRNASRHVKLKAILTSVRPTFIKAMYPDYIILTDPIRVAPPRAESDGSASST